MTIQECYDAMGGNYGEAASRLVKDERIRKFALMFLKDPSYQNLRTAMDEGRTEDAFFAAHTLKGVARNLSFTELGDAASEVTEALRGAGSIDTAVQLMPAVDNAYRKVVDALGSLD